MFLQTWQDLCSKTKGKQSQINKYTKGTGGGPSLPTTEQLTPMKQQVLETMCETTISGHNDILETDVTLCIFYFYIYIKIFLYLG